MGARVVKRDGVGCWFVLDIGDCSMSSWFESAKSVGRRQFSSSLR